MKTAPTTVWTTKAGTLTTTRKAQLKFLLPEFNQSKIISWACHVDDTATASNSQYNMILGRDLLETLGIIINFNDHTITWDEATILMKKYGRILTLHTADTYCNKIFTTNIKNEVTTRMRQILYTKYKKADLAKVVADSKHLTTDEQSKLLAVLCRYKTIFDGGLGLWKTPPASLS